MNDTFILPDEVMATLHAMLDGKRSGQVIIDFHQGAVTKARVTWAIEWARTQERR
jgi:hypothetical protein